MVSRGYEKLKAAFQTLSSSSFPLSGKGEVAPSFSDKRRRVGEDEFAKGKLGGWVCVDLGCSTGGFTEYLLRQGADKVYSVDTGYGVLDYKLRNDERVVVLERTNAMHVELPEKCDLVVADLSWTCQKHALPAALKLVKPGGTILSLLKPQYELAPLRKAGLIKPRFIKRTLAPETSREIFDILIEELWEQFPIEDSFESMVKGKKGNIEYWLKLK